MVFTEDVSVHRNVAHLPLHPWHVSQGAKLMSFGNWEVPAYYTGILDEHHCVRNKAGLFDISHMGQILVDGTAAKSDIDRWITNSAGKLGNNKALYSPLCNEKGGIIDDIIVYQITPSSFLIVVNAGNIAKDFEWFKAHRSADTVIKNISDEMAMFALQGPKAREVGSKALGIPHNKIQRFEFCSVNIDRNVVWVLRTGYTGEDGYEFIAPMQSARVLWEKIMSAGKSVGIQPIGFGARDTLRLEAAYRLHGQDMNSETTPFEAGLGWAVDMKKSDFLGKSALSIQKERGLEKVLVGFVMEDRSVARHDYEIFHESQCVGRVTSGSVAPTLDKSIGLGYVKQSVAKEGVGIKILIRDKEHNAKIVKLPFFKKEFEK